VLHDPFLDLNDIDKEQFREIEREANDFAASFLLPKDAFAKDISVAPVDFDNYKHLKKKWKVSISAMTVRAYKIGVISYNQYNYLQRQISQNNRRRQEPLDELLKPGVPLAMKKAVELLLKTKL
jgi:Zn-dependent peptidase ImmA (M78 family)